MKKIVSTFALALLVGGLTFAQDASVKIGAWGRGLFVPVATGGVDAAGDAATQSALGVSWGGLPRVGFTIAGTSEFVGFQTDINVDLAAPSAGDQQKIWVKAAPGLLIQVGQAYDDTLRGNTAFGSFDWIRLGPINDEDNVFKRVDTQKGITAGYTLDALYVFGAFTGLSNTAVSLQETALKNTQVGAGYTIANVGLIRGQFIGQGNGNSNLIEGAFRLTAVENLYADIGIKYPLDADKYGGTSMLVNAYANYTTGAAKIHGLVTYAPNKESDANALGVGAGLDYGLGDGLGFGADLRYYSQKEAFGPILDATDSLITVFAGISKGFSNGMIGVGVQYATTAQPLTAGANAGEQGGAFGLHNPDVAGQFYLPVKVEYWF